MKVNFDKNIVQRTIATVLVAGILLAASPLRAAEEDQNGDRSSRTTSTTTLGVDMYGY